jgi:L-fucose isomerase-like protein
MEKISMSTKVKLGFLPSNWDAWDGPLADGSRWATKMRNRVVDAIKNIPEIELIVPSVSLTGDGCVSNRESAGKALELFRAENIQGLLVGNMTFGMEVAVSLVLNGLSKDMPILHFCTRSGPIEPTDLGGHRTTDTWCGQFMTTSAMRRRGFKFHHVRTCNPEEPEFLRSVELFARAVMGISNFRRARIGQLGTRPELFESQVVNEQLLQRQFAQMVVPMDMTTVFAYIEEVNPKSAEVTELIRAMTQGIKLYEETNEALINIARYELAVKRVVKELDVQAIAANCWTQIQKQFHISTCSTFGRLNNQGIITACEVDVMGAVTMWALYNLAFRKAIPDFIDWTDLHPTEPNTWLAWHCGNAAACLKDSACKPMLSRNERMIQWCPTCFGALELKLKNGPVTCARLLEYDGQFTMFVGKGEIVDMQPSVRGAYGWVKVKDVGLWEDRLIEAGGIHHGCLIHDPYVAEAMEMFCYFLGINVVWGDR